MFGLPKGNGGKGGQEFAVIGLGRFGTSVAKTLTASGHTVLGIDSEEALVNRYQHILTDGRILDSTDEEALKDIDIASYGTVVVAIGANFEANLMTTVALKRLEVQNVICKATTLIQRDILLRVGADQVVLPEYEAGERLAQMIVSPTVVSQMTLCPGVGISELKVPKSLVGRKVEDVDHFGRYDLTLIAIQRGPNVMVNPKRGIVFREDDLLIVIGPSDAVQRFSEHA